MRGGRRGGRVVQPLHRTTLITPTRCDPMMAASSRDWNVFKQIFADHWEPFQQAHPHYQTAYYDSLVAKMLACGNPEKIETIASLPGFDMAPEQPFSYPLSSTIGTRRAKLCLVRVRICR